MRFGVWILVGVWILGFGVSQLRAAAAPATPRDPIRVDEKTDPVIKGALKWLASKQAPNGAWGSTDMEQQYPIAITGYALMAFQAAGHLPGEGEYGKNVSLGMQYLIDSIASDGLMGNKNNGQYMYGHGVATIALAELYGQTKSPTARVKLDKIVKVIVSSQNNEGGWRYRPIAYQADVSVTVLQVVGLRAAKNAGLDVPQATIDRAVDYVKKCQDPASGGFAYQPGQAPGFARTAAAIYSLQVCGLYDDPMVKAGSELPLQELQGLARRMVDLRQLLRRARPIHARRRDLGQVVHAIQGDAAQEGHSQGRHRVLGPGRGADRQRPQRRPRLCDERVHHDARHALPLHPALSAVRWATHSCPCH